MELLPPVGVACPVGSDWETASNASSENGPTTRRVYTIVRIGNCGKLLVIKCTGSAGFGRDLVSCTAALEERCVTEAPYICGWMAAKFMRLGRRDSAYAGDAYTV